MAVFLVRQREAVYILADGAAVAPDGKLIGIAAKIVPAPRLVPAHFARRWACGFAASRFSGATPFPRRVLDPRRARRRGRACG
jgi:hypothetical protein